MKIFIIVLLCFISKVCFSQCDVGSTLSTKDSLIKEFILKLPKEEYKDLTIEKIVGADSLRNFCNRSYIQKIVGVLSGVELSYRGFVNVRLIIYGNDAKRFRGKAKDWIFDEVKECKVLRIDIRDRSLD